MDYLLHQLQALNILKSLAQLSASLTNEASHNSAVTHQPLLPKRSRSLSKGCHKQAIFEPCSLCMLMKLSRGCDQFIPSLVEMRPAHRLNALGLKGGSMLER